MNFKIVQTQGANCPDHINQGTWARSRPCHNRAAIRFVGALVIALISCMPAARAVEVWTFEDVAFIDEIGMGPAVPDTGTITGSFTVDASDNILSFDFTESADNVPGFPADNLPAVTYNSSAGDTVQFNSSLDEYTFSDLTGDGLNLVFASPLPLNGGTDQFATAQDIINDLGGSDSRLGVGEVTTPVSAVPDTGSTAFLLSIAAGIMLILRAISTFRRSWRSASSVAARCHARL